MASHLSVSHDLALPTSWATSTAGILAKRGAGKSNAAVVMAEEMFDAGVAFVAVDPKGDWYGIRSSASGKGPGLPIPVFGGRHGDVPLEATAGSLVADIVNEKGLTCVLDVSEFSKADQRRFLIAFGERLYRARSDEADVLHLFLEEAHEYLPQRVMRDEAQMVNTWGRIVKQGRFRGIGCTLISQRSASLNKDVLTQVDSLIVLRTTAPQDRKAVLAWVEEHDAAHELVGSLPSLDDGEAWVWSPETLHTTKRIRFRRRRTFDSGATPEVGKSRRAPATLADVDLAAIKEQMAETIEKAKADDPKELRRRIADLERQLRERPAAEPEIREVPVVTPEGIDALASAERQMRSATDAVSDASREVIDAIDGLFRRFDAAGVAKASSERGVDMSKPSQAVVPSSTPKRQPFDKGGFLPTGRTTVRRSSVPVDGDLPEGEAKILTAVAQHGTATRQQLTVLTGYKRSTRDAYIQRLRQRGYLEVLGQDVTATGDGMAALGDSYEPLSTGAALREHWLAKLPEGESAVLAHVCLAWPAAVFRDDISEATGYKRSTRDAYIQRLKARQLIDVVGGGVVASPTLFD